MSNKEKRFFEANTEHKKHFEEFEKKIQNHIDEIKIKQKDKNLKDRNLWIKQIKMLELDLKYHKTSRIHY